MRRKNSLLHDVRYPQTDKFESRQSDSIIGNLGKAESILGISDIHHDSGTRFGQLIDGNIGDLKRKNAFVDVAFFSFRATDRDRLSCLETSRRRLRSNDGGNP